MLVAQRQPTQILLRVRRVHRHHIKFVVFGGDDAALAARIALQFVGKLVALGDGVGKTVDHIERFALAENRRAGIAFFHRRIPVLAVIGQIDLHLIALGLGFLQAQNVGLDATR